MGLKAVLGLVCLMSCQPIAAFADDVPKGRAQFTDYIISRLQPYTLEHLAPSRWPATGIGSIAVGSKDEYISTEIIYFICYSNNFKCNGSIDLFVQDTVYIYLTFPKPDPSTMRAGLFLATNKGNDLDDGWAKEGGAVGRDLDGMLMEVCFIDPERKKHELRTKMLSDLGLDFDSAIKLCERNLRSAIGPLPSAYGQLGPDHIGMVRGSRSESARMILLDQMAQLQEMIGGHLIVATPTPDILVYSNVDDESGVAALEARAKQIALSSRLPLAFDIYEFTGRGWKQLTADEHGKGFLIQYPH